MADTGGFNIRNAEIENILRDLGRRMKGEIPEGWGFALLMFNFGEGGSAGDGMFYISSAQRDTMISAMKEFIARNEH